MRRVRSAIARAARRIQPVRGALRPLRHPYEDLPLLIVSGVGRSGTTALRNAIAACARIDAANRESNFIRDLLEVALRNCTLPVRRASMAVTQQEYDLVFRRAILWLAWPQPWREQSRARRFRQKKSWRRTCGGSRRSTAA